MTITEGANSDALDVERIMVEIRAQIAERQEQGELVEPDLNHYRLFRGIPPELSENQRDLNTRWDQIYEPFEVRSRLPVLGPLWAMIRRRIHGEVRAYLDPMIWRQVEFNASAVRSLNALVREVYEGLFAANLQALNREVLRLRAENHALQARVQDLERATARRVSDG